MSWGRIERTAVILPLPASDRSLSRLALGQYLRLWSVGWSLSQNWLLLSGQGKEWTGRLKPCTRVGRQVHVRVGSNVLTPPECSLPSYVGYRINTEWLGKATDLVQGQA